MERDGKEGEGRGQGEREKGREPGELAPLKHKNLTPHMA
jgi:hypothetical protein